MSGYRDISIDEIDVPKGRVRKDIEEARLEDLAQSIREHGVIEPVVVRVVGQRYEVVCGVRRVWACRMCGQVLVPCRIVEANDEQVGGMEMVENMMREDLNVVDEAMGVFHLLERADGDVKKVSGWLRKSEEWVRGRNGILDWPGDVQGALRRGEIGLSVARELVKCDDEKVRAGFLDAAVKGGCTARTMCGWVSEWRASQGGPVSVGAAEIVARQTSPPPKVAVRCSGCGRGIGNGELRTLILCAGCYEALKKEMEKE